MAETPTDVKTPVSTDSGSSGESFLKDTLAEASKISDASVEKEAKTGDASKIESQPVPENGSLGLDIATKIDQIEVTVGVNESVVQDRQLLSADEAKAYVDILKTTKGTEDVATKAGVREKDEYVSRTIKDPEGTTITSEALVDSARRAKSQDTFDLNTVDFRKGGIMEGISTFKDKSVDQAMADTRQAVETFKQQNPNASASMINEVTKRVEGLLGRLIHDPVKGRSETFIRDAQGKTAGQNEYAGRVASMRESDMKSNFRRQAVDHSSSVLKETEGSFANSLISIDQNPDNLESEIQTFSSNYIRNAKIAGVSPDKIKKTLNTRIKEATVASVKSQIRTDPYAAQKFIEDNAERLGKNALSLMTSARTKQASLESKRKNISKERQIKEAIPYLPTNLSELKKLEKSDGIDGEAAQKQVAIFNKDPQRFAEEMGIVRFSNLDTEDAASITDRIADVKLASNAIGENVPILNKDEVRSIKEGVTDTRQTMEFLDFFSKTDISDRYRIAAQFGDSALGAAIIQSDPGIKRDIIAGMSSDALIDRDKAPENRLLYPMDAARNIQANKAIDALMRTGKYDQEEATKAIVNKQQVGGLLRKSGLLGALFGGAYDLILPSGTTAEQFDKVSESILSSEALIKKYGNGDPKKLRTPTGAFVTIDSDDVRWVPTTGGKYALFNGLDDDAEPVVKENGALFEIRLEEAMRINTSQVEQTDPSEEINNDLRAAAGLTRR